MDDFDKEMVGEDDIQSIDGDTMDNIDKIETLVTRVPLDGAKLSKEIMTLNQTSKLNKKGSDVGIRNKDDMSDLLSGVKGASTFMNKTPKD